MVVGKGVGAEGSWRGHTFSPVRFFVLHESNSGKNKKKIFLDSVTRAINAAAEKASTCKRKVCWAQNIFFLPPPSALLHGFHFCGNQYGGAAVKSNTGVTFSLPL